MATECQGRDPRALQIVRAAIGEGARDGGCKHGADVLLAAGLEQALQHAGRSVLPLPAVTADALQAQDRMDTVARFNANLAQVVAQALVSGAQLLVLGGDHSCALGTWSGVAQALRSAPPGGPAGPLGLIWVDAHLDAHTIATSESQAPHGMPVAALLGHGSPAFTDLCGWSGKLLPQHLVLIGVRSYERAERQLLEQLGVRVMYMHEVAQRGFVACFSEARHHLLRSGCVAWGLSIDVDGLDPQDAPATGTPVAHGISLTEAIQALQQCRADPQPVALEIAEYNPLKDFGGATARAVQALAVAALGTRLVRGEEGFLGVQGCAP